jgi:hypothetical protein
VLKGASEKGVIASLKAELDEQNTENVRQYILNLKNTLRKPVTQ